MEPESEAYSRTFLNAVARLIRDGYRLSDWKLPPPVVIALAFESLHGSHAPTGKRVAFLIAAAPMARKIALTFGPQDGLFCNGTIRTSAIKDWYEWSAGSLAATAADLHYFAGFSVKQTAVILEQPVRLVLQDLKSAKKIVQITL